jgi:hypothetical protein
MKHFVFGGVATAPAAVARNEDDMKIAKVKEIEAFSL